MKKQFSFLLILNLNLVSCGSSSSVITTVATKEEFEVAQLTMMTRLISDCCQLTKSQQEKLKLFYDSFNQIEKIDIVENGWLRFNVDQANQCLKETISVLSCTNANPNILACEETFVPKQAQGEICGEEVDGVISSFDEVCVDGLSCAKTVCLPPKKVGEQCDLLKDVCEDGANCTNEICIAHENEDEDEDRNEVYDQVGCEQLKAQLDE